MRVVSYWLPRNHSLAAGAPAVGCSRPTQYHCSISCLRSRERSSQVTFDLTLSGVSRQPLMPDFTDDLREC